MPYYGTSPSTAFSSLPTRQEFSGDGSTTTFTLNNTVSSEQDIVVSVDGVVQEPTGAYTVPDGVTLTFTAAPSSNSGNNIFVMFFGRTFETVTPAAENKGNFKAGGLFRTNAQSLTSDLTILTEQAENILKNEEADLIALARELLHNPNWTLDAALKLGAENPYQVPPPAYDYWLEKRASSVTSVTPSTYFPGSDLNSFKG